MEFFKNLDKSWFFLVLKSAYFVKISPCFVMFSVRFVGEISFLSRRKLLYLFKKNG